MNLENILLIECSFFRNSAFVVLCLYVIITGTSLYKSTSKFAYILNGGKLALVLNRYKTKIFHKMILNRYVACAWEVIQKSII